MADRFPLIVNATSKKIEELVSGDNLELTGNGISISGNTGVSGQYLRSNGFTIEWGNPGDVYLTQSQTLTNKVFETCSLSGSTNIFTNIPNNALVNSSISVNGVSIPLGGFVTTPDNNTTYSVSAVDGLSSSSKRIRLTSGGNAGADVTDDVTIAVGVPSSVPTGSNPLSLFIDRTDDTITISGQVVDNNTVTSIQSAVGGTAQTGAITIAATGASTVSQDAGTRTITINTVDNDTITRLRAGTGQAFNPGDFTFLAGTSVSLTQGVDGNSKPTITVASSDTVTRLKGGGSGTFQSGDITIQGGSGGNVTVSQSGNTISIDSTDTNTVTQLASGPSNPLAAGNFRFVASGASTISQSINAGVTTIEISSVNSDTGASLTAGEGLTLTNGTEYSIKNVSNLIDNRVIKWDNANNQIANSIITDDGTTVTVNGNFNVTGTNTVINTTTLSVADNIIELRRGNSLTGTDAGVQVNRTTNSAGSVTGFIRLEWYEAGAHWRSYDGSVARRFVTENETQTLTNKTLTSPTLTNPSLGTATATTINGLTIASTASSTIDIADLKTLNFNNSLTFNGTDGSTINFGNGGGAGAQVAYSSNTLASFATTTSTQLRGVVSDSSGTGVLVFSTSPQFNTSVTTNSSTFAVFNTSATTVNAFGAATALNMGASSGTTTINNSLTVGKNFEVNTIVGDTFTVNGTPNFVNSDIIIRGSGSTPMKIGRGGNAVNTNTRIGFNCLENNTTGSQNTSIGYEALLTNLAGASNVAAGYRALRANSSGFANVAIGKDSQLVNQEGDGNVAIGSSSLESNITGNYNVCIGHFAGYGLLGSGNVLIGAASDENSTNATYVPLSASGNNQLVIASGTEAWIRGDSAYNVAIPNNLRVNGDTIIDGTLTVNGTVTSINSNTISIDDKNIELAAVVTTTFDASVQNGQTTITGVTPTSGLIPGMTLVSLTGGISVPIGTYIVSIANNTAVLSDPVSGSTGSATFEATGPTDLGADGGGIILRGATNKTILYDHSRTDKYWTFSENIEIAPGKKFVIGNQLALSSTTLGATVVNSSLTSVGTLTGLSVDGSTTLGGRVVEKVFNSFTTTLTPASNVLTINVAGSNTILGKPTTSAINTWAFTGIGLTNGQSITVTLILEGNTAATYGDACTVDGDAVSNGIRWSGGSPPLSTTNTDILTFVIVKDNSGNTRVYGQGNTDFS
jgi:hypothetical protein